MKLYIGNLPWKVDDSGLKEMFASYGADEANVISDKFSGRSKGFGFVTIADDESANKAISEMNDKEIEGRAIKVSEAKPMVPRDNAPQAESSESSEAPAADPDAIDQSGDFE